LECLYKLGALWTPAVVAGEWWRLLAAQFLHLGVLHLLMNMLALAWLGPIVENSFGTLRFLVIYLLAGTGSMGFVLFRELGAVEPTLLVGASGCIMGLIGAMAASLWRGWRVHHARIARLRLRSVIAIVLMQTTFDLLVPQVSMAAHLTGIFIGFVTALALRDKTETPPARATGTTEPPPAPSA